MSGEDVTAAILQRIEKQQVTMLSTLDEHGKQLARIEVMQQSQPGICEEMKRRVKDTEDAIWPLKTIPNRMDDIEKSDGSRKFWAAIVSAAVAVMFWAGKALFGKG